jgi:DNA helicase IV
MLIVKARHIQLFLHWAVKHDFYQVTKLVIFITKFTSLSPISMRDRFGNTALHVAAFNDACSTAKFLVGRGANIHVKNIQVETPLDVAIRENCLAMGQLLRSLQGLEDYLDQDWFAADSFFRKNFSGYLTPGYLDRLKSTFVRSWLGTQSGQERDDEQVRAIGATSRNNLVTARAGSGKTVTLIDRVMFLIERCGVRPEEIMVLAFNRKAVVDVREKLKSRFNTPAGSFEPAEEAEYPFVRTFHALAYGIVHPEETPLYDSDEDPRHTNFIKRHVIDPFLKDKTSAEHQLMRKVMLDYFRSDWSQYFSANHEQGSNRKEELSFRLSMPNVGLDGTYYKSRGEKIIANYLFEHDISFKYEKNVFWNGVNYRPDFTIFGLEESPRSSPPIILEFFGRTGDPDYDKQSEEKRQFWEEPVNRAKGTFVEITPRDFSGSSGLSDLLEKMLERHGIVGQRLDDDEIWKRIGSRVESEFAKTISRFINTARQRSISSIQLKSLIDSHSTSSTVESNFLNIANLLHDRYLDQLRTAGFDDFNGLIMKAESAIRRGSTIFRKRGSTGDLSKLKHILIDEFQDFSDLSAKMLASILQQNDGIHIFAVGDDWQAINSFAGSELSYFKNPGQYFGTTTKLDMTRNYRSDRSIVEAGNAVMTGFGVSGISTRQDLGSIEISDHTEIELSPVERSFFSNSDVVIPALLRQITPFLSTGKTVAILSRTKRPNFLFGEALESFGSRLEKLIPEASHDKLYVSTIHGFKGLQADAVVVIDGSFHNYPLIHPLWIFDRVWGTSVRSIIEEERRLFYVAVTRAKSRVVIFSERDYESLYVKSLYKVNGVSRTNWDDMADGPILEDYWTIRITNNKGKSSAPTVQISGLLKNSGYSFVRNSDEPWLSYWLRHIHQDKFNINLVHSESWVNKADNVRINIFDGRGVLVESHDIEDGIRKE